MDPKKETNFYKPDGDDGEGVVDSASPVAAKETLSWTASEYIEHKRGASWYGLLALIIALIATAIYFLMKDYFAVVIVVIVGIMLGVFAGHKPREMTYELSSSGLKIGEKLYSFHSFRSFAVMREGPLCSFTLYPLKRFMLPVSAYYDINDEDKIADIIGNRLPLEDRAPDGIDRLTRRLKL